MIEDTEKYIAPIACEVELDVKQFIDKSITSFTKWDIIIFFNIKSNKFETIESISQNIGKEIKKIRDDVDQLVSQGFLRKVNGNIPTFYSCPQDKEKIKIIKKFLNYSKTEDGRIRIICHILRESNLL